MIIEHISIDNVLIPLAASDLPKPTGRNYGAFMLVRIQCDNGLVGTGEGYCGNATAAVAAVITDMLAPEIEGQDPTHIAGLYERMYRAGFYFGRNGVISAAISAVEIALWDIAGQHFKAPVHAMLGGSVRGAAAPYPSLRQLVDNQDPLSIPAYASLQTYTRPDEVARAARAAVEAGYGSVKLHQVDLESVRVTRSAVGDDIEITMDPTGYFNPIEAERFAAHLADYGVGWLEEPIWPPDDYAALARLRSRSPIPIAGGENEATIWGFNHLFDQQAVDILQPEVAILGGILESFKVYTMAQSKNIPVAPHNFHFGPVLAASAHLSLMFPNVFILETPWYQLEADILKAGPAIVSGRVEVPATPGLGIVVDEEVVRDYRVEAFPRK
jgi:L-alanine-DL-glutamate epimerase-like enolase superfamily enzyme